MTKSKGMDLTTGPIFNNLLKFSLPLIASNLLQQFYTTADQIVVGRFAGDTALAAVGSISYLSNLILNLVTGLSLGATVVCAKYVGAKNKERISRTVHTSMMLAIVSGFLLLLVGVLFSRTFLEWMDTPADVINHSVTYMTIIFLGKPFSMVYNFGASLLRASGDTKRPLKILTVSGLTNVILNVIFVVCFNMAEAGVALATIISEMVSSAAILYLMLNRDDDLKLEWKKIRFHKDELSNVIKVGIPTGINAILFNIANISLQSTINGFGKEYIAANTASGNINHYITVIQNAFGAAALSFVGQNYGAKKYKRIDKVIVISIITATAITVALVLVVCAIPEVFLSLFTTEQKVIECGVDRTIIMAWGIILNAPAAIFVNGLRGMEKSKTPMFLNILSICVSRIVWIYLVFPLNPTFKMLFYCYPLSWGLSGLSTGMAYYLHRKKVFFNQEQAEV